MSMIQKKRNNRRKENSAFAPDRSYIEAATAEFLELGGKIDFIEYDVSVQNFDAIETEPCADNFLMGER